MGNTHEKMLNTAHQERNANQNYNEISLHTSQNGHHQKVYKQQGCWKGCGEKGTLLHCWWECKLIQPLWRTVWRFLKKRGIKPPYDPAIPLLGVYPEETKVEKYTCILLFIAALFYNSYNMEATQMSTGRRMDKEVVVHIHNGILLSHKKECI